VDCKAPIKRSLDIASTPPAVEEVCSRVTEELKAQGYGKDDVFAVHLALEEALTNAVIHGNQLAPDKQVRIDYVICPDKFEVSIADQGDGFDPEAVPDPRREENLYKTEGRGLLLMRSYMDSVEFNEVGNAVRMVRYKGGSALPKNPDA